MDLFHTTFSPLRLLVSVLQLYYARSYRAYSSHGILLVNRICKYHLRQGCYSRMSVCVVVIALWNERSSMVGWKEYEPQR